jgi:hypothetical protein
MLFPLLAKQWKRIKVLILPFKQKLQTRREKDVFWEK